MTRYAVQRGSVWDAHYLLLLPFALWAVVIIVSLYVYFFALAVISEPVNDCLHGTLQVLSSTSYMAMLGNRGRVTGCLKCRCVCVVPVPLHCCAQSPAGHCLRLQGPQCGSSPHQVCSHAPAAGAQCTGCCLCAGNVS